MGGAHLLTQRGVGLWNSLPLGAATAAPEGLDAFRLVEEKSIASYDEQLPGFRNGPPPSERQVQEGSLWSAMLPKARGGVHDAGVDAPALA